MDGVLQADWLTVVPGTTTAAAVALVVAVGQSSAALRPWGRAGSVREEQCGSMAVGAGRQRWGRVAPRDRGGELAAAEQRGVVGLAGGRELHVFFIVLAD